MLLWIGAIIVELAVGVMLLGGISYGITQTYAIGAAGYSRLSWFGAVLAVMFLWLFAWFPALFAGVALRGLPEQWRDPTVSQKTKIGMGVGVIPALFMMASFMSGIGEGLTNLVAVG